MPTQAVEEVIRKLIGSGHNDIAHELIQLKSLLSLDDKGTTIAASSFTLEKVINDFNLSYSPHVGLVGSNPHRWKIIDKDDDLDFPMSSYFSSLIFNYSRNFERSSEAVCRTAIDLVFNECLTIMKGCCNDLSNCPKTPMHYDDIRVHGELAFNHMIFPSHTSQNVTVAGCIDYGIGRVMINPQAAGDAANNCRRRFQSLLIIIEAKTHQAISQAIPQLLTYLACLRQSRLQRGRKDGSVYGVVSDGFVWLFVNINHAGTVKITRNFDLLGGDGDIQRVLWCLCFILQVTAGLSPNVTPEKDGWIGSEEKVGENHDPSIELDGDAGTFLTGEL